MGKMNKRILYGLIGFFGLMLVMFVINGPIESEALPTSSSGKGVTSQSQHPAVIGTSGDTAQPYRGARSTETKTVTAGDAASNREFISAILIIFPLAGVLWYMARGGKPVYLKEPIRTY